MTCLPGRNNDWQSALGYLREAEKDGVTVDDMWNVALLSLEEQLLNNSQPLPWKVRTSRISQPLPWKVRTSRVRSNVDFMN